MKIIVVSDSHGSSHGLKRVMKLNRNADAVVHCGDSRGEMEEIKMLYPDKQYFEVRGNCDYGSTLPLYTVFTLDGFTYMATHGHAYHVKFGMDDLVRAAKELGANAVFYGHTHIPHDEIIDGVHVLCPGACGGIGATFGVVETKDGQMLTNLARIRP